MSKSLTESAAEILKASLSSAGKEQPQKLPAAVDDLGGATATDDYSGAAHGEKDVDVSIGKKAAAAVKQAKAPKGPEVPAEPMKMAAEETEEEDDEVLEEDSSEDEEFYSEEEIAEAKKQHMKGMIAKYKGSMAEDVGALFNGESLSEDFRAKATTIFEAAVQSRVEAIVEEVLEENDAVLAEAVEGIKAEIAEQVDEYLNYVVEQWLEENQVAIESGLRAELSEDFINGLKNLFTEHYIEIPDEKLEVAESLAEKVVELEEENAILAEEYVATVTALNEAKKNEAIRKICEGLTETQIAKMKSLAEGVEFTTEGEFDDKLATIRENYFPNKKIVSEVKEADASSDNSKPEVEVPSHMVHYVNAISKTLPK